MKNNKAEGFRHSQENVSWFWDLNKKILSQLTTTKRKQFRRGRRKMDVESKKMKRNQKFLQI